LACSTGALPAPVNLDDFSGIAAGQPGPVIAVPYNGPAGIELGPHLATYEAFFDGAFDWRYILITRYDGQNLEHSLHIEGVGARENPGDVRLVSDGTTSRMRGAGTDDECFLFPSTLDLGFSFLTPDSLLAPAALNQHLVPVENNEILSLGASHYEASQPSLDGWINVEVDVWISHATSTALRYDMRASGPDPLFNAGDGNLTAQYRVHEIAPQEIAGVDGCDIELPLPPDAVQIARFPGVITFESPSSAESIMVFYQQQLNNWQLVGEPEVGEDAVVMAFERGSRSLLINIERLENGVKVQLLEQ
jgi:hypothetical protein